MRRAVERLKQNNKKSTFILQLTAMVDMFTIMIVFLLKSFSTSAVHIAPHQGMKMPVSSSYVDPIEALRVVVAVDGIYLDNNMVVAMSEGKLGTRDVDPNDPDFIKPLYEALDKEANKTKEISKLNEEIEFTGQIVMQADSRLNYEILKKVMYTSSLAGYAEMKLATMAIE